MSETALVGVVRARTSEGPVEIGEMRHDDLSGFSFTPYPTESFSELAIVSQRIICAEWPAFQKGYQENGVTFDDEGVARQPKIVRTLEHNLDGDTVKIALLGNESVPVLRNICRDLTNGVTELVLALEHLKVPVSFE